MEIIIIHGKIKPVKNGKDEEEIISQKYSFMGGSMTTDILQNNIKIRNYNSDKDNPHYLLMALKRYPIVLEANAFHSLPNDLKINYLKILLSNIKNGYIELDDYNGGINELRDQYYLNFIFNNDLTFMININAEIDRLIFDNLWRCYNDDIINDFINSYKGNDKEVLSNIDLIKEA